MIGQRYAVAGKSVAPERARRGAVLAPTTLLDWRRLSRSLRQSAVVQLGFAMACFAIAGILYLAQASQSSVLEYNISVLQSQQAQLDGQNATLRATATQLQSLQRIDAIATQQLHMARPDLRTAIWINPVLLRAATVHSTHADLVAAERASQPLAWMKRFLRLVRASL